jgi:hypothetical protein
VRESDVVSAWLARVVDDIVRGVYDGWDRIWLGRIP